MKIAQAALWLCALLTLARLAPADTLVLKNGDHLTGTIETSDAKVITFKTDYG